MKKIYLLNDYLTSKTTLKNIENSLSKQFENYEIVSLDFSDYYNATEVDKIDLESVINFFKTELEQKIDQDDILVGIGVSTRILCSFNDNQKILINPLLFNNLINVFTASKKYFENNQDQYKVYLDKLIDTEEINIDQEYSWYSNHYSKIIKLTEKINLYETLKSLINSDNELLANSQIFITDNNQILDNKTTLKYLKKLSKKIKLDINVINSNKHLVMEK